MKAVPGKEAYARWRRRSHPGAFPTFSGGDERKFLGGPVRADEASVATVFGAPVNASCQVTVCAETGCQANIRTINRGFILGDPDFRATLVQAIERSADAVAKGAVLHPAKEELQKVVKDYMFFIQAHGSEYATRRLKELLATLEKL